MSQIRNKFIESASGSTVTGVDGLKFRLQNNQALRARNAANSADVTLLSLSASDVITMGGLLSMGSNRITNVTDPSSAQDAATKNYVDTNFANISLAAVGASPNANAATLTGQVLNLEPASVSFPGVVTTGTQSFAGSKSFSASVLPTVNASGISLGSTSFRWFNVNAGGEVVAYAGTGDASISLSGSVTAPSGGTFRAVYASNITGTAEPLLAFTLNNGTADANATGQVRIESGNKTAGTGNSGNITLQTGTSSGGTRGSISLNGSSIDANSTQIHNVSDPTSAQDAATKNYVDNMSVGLSWKQVARAATTADITLSAPQTIDGVSVIAGDRVLVKDQSDATENGIYVVAAGAWSRSTDADTGSELVGAAIFVSEGTVNADIAFVNTTDAPITIGSSNIIFVQFSSIPYTFGDGLDLTGNNVSVLAADSSIAVGAGGVNVAYNASGALETSTGVRVRVDAVTTKINGSNNLEGLKDISENLTLNGTDITNQYKDLSFAVYGTSASVNSVVLSVVGGPVQQKTVDYTVSLTGGSGGVTRITFAGDLATGGAAELISGDILMISYSYLT